MPCGSPRPSSPSARTSTATMPSPGRSSRTAAPTRPGAQMAEALALGTRDAKLLLSRRHDRGRPRQRRGGTSATSRTRSRLDPSFDPLAVRTARTTLAGLHVMRAVVRAVAARHCWPSRCLLPALVARPPARQLHDQPLRRDPRIEPDRVTPRRRHRPGRDPGVPGASGARRERGRRGLRRRSSKRAGSPSCRSLLPTTCTWPSAGSSRRSRR